MQKLYKIYDGLTLSKIQYVFNRRLHYLVELPSCLSLQSQQGQGGSLTLNARSTLVITPFISTFSSRSRCDKRHFNSSSCSFQPLRNHYEILKINRTATTEEIREAFLKLTKEHHPDINSGDPKENHIKFVAINEAYTVLSKPSLRHDYDLTLQVRNHLRQQARRPYGYQTDTPYYHYHRNRSHVDWEGTSSSSFQEGDKFRSGKRLHHLLMNFFSLTAVFTIGCITLILGCKEYILPALPRKHILGKESDLSNHEFIMTSVYEGQTVLYYAVPDDDKPDAFKIRAFLKKEVEGEPNEYILEELIRV